MKKVILGLIALLSFTACHKDDIEQLTVQEIKDAQYSVAFKQVFGEIKEGHTWGDWTFPQTYVARAVTRASNNNGNIWYQDWERPYNVNLSAQELNELKGLLTKNGETINTEIFPYENYWVEQIYKGESLSDTYNNLGRKYGDPVKGSNHMNHLQARDGNSYIHINNFNNGNNTTQYTDEGNGTKYVGITLMENMSLDGITATNQFGYDESWGTENNKFYNNYLIVKYKGEYYVGFDFEAHKSTSTMNENEAMQINRDWAFTDWIVRISPAIAKEKEAKDYGYAKRIMCEDLGAIGDFDFNDVVFDVFIGWVKGKNQTVITIQCAGGMLPLKVAGVEVHDALNISSTQMANTGGGEGNKKVKPYTFFVDDTFDYNAKNIPVVVKDDSGAVLVISAKDGEAPQKFCTTTSTRWATGKTHIYDAYRGFKDWVNNNTQDWDTNWTNTAVEGLVY